jgi:hypothetical protein
MVLELSVKKNISISATEMVATPPHDRVMASMVLVIQ